MKNVNWNAAHPLTEQGLTPGLTSGSSQSVLHVLRTARNLQTAIDRPILREHDLQVMWLAYRLACACEAVDLQTHDIEGHRGSLKPGSLSAEQVLWAGLLHDVGKHVLPEVILAKPTPLTVDERQVMQTHSLHGYRIAAQLAEQHGISAIDGVVLDGILHHHERFNGEGYPVGLIGESIPLLARVLAVVDVYVALTSHRPYRTAWTQRAALDYLLAHQGTLFDPRIVQHAVRVFEYH